MNNQEFFDKSVAHLRKQGCKASNGGGCKYRLVADDGGPPLACAVGGVMPDELAAAVIERGLNGAGTLRLLFNSPEAKEFFRGVHRGLLADMQYVHDEKFPEDWEAGFERVADDHSLTYTPPAT